MKRTTTLLLLLALSCLLSACSFVPEEERIPIYDYTLPPLTEETKPAETEPPEKPAEPCDPALLIGDWYAKTAAIVLQFFNDQTVKLYNLAPGYYAYQTIESGTYTYDGFTLTCDFDSESDFNFPCTVDATQMKLSSSYQPIVFTHTETLPEAHPVYTFPSFAELATANPLPEGAYIGNTIPTTLRAEALTSIQQSYWEKVTPDKMVKLESGTAKLGDLVNIDYEGKLDGVAFAGGTATNQVLEVNDGTGYIDGFAAGIAGHEVGTTFDVPVTFPENYGSKDLAGKAVVFTMTLNCIYDLTLSDTIAVEEGYESLDAWIDSVYTPMLEAEVWRLIPALKDVAIPEAAYMFFYQGNLDYFHAIALYYFDGDYDACLVYFGYTEEMILEESICTAKEFYYAQLIANHYSLTADDALTEKVTKEFLKMYTDDGYTEEQAKAILEGEGRAEFQARLTKALAAQYLLAENTFTEAVAQNQ